MGNPNYLTGKISPAKRLDLMVAEIPSKYLSHLGFAKFLGFRKNFEYRLAAECLIELEAVADEKFTKEFWLHALELAREFRDADLFGFCSKKLER